MQPQQKKQLEEMADKIAQWRANIEHLIEIIKKSGDGNIGFQDGECGKT
jgi:hypothetical protein